MPTFAVSSQSFCQRHPCAWSDSLGKPHEILQPTALARFADQTDHYELNPTISLRLNWQPYTLRFRQNFEEGYRYLDRCGEFMIAAARELKFLAGEPKVTGAQLMIPEKGIQANVDAHSLELRQEAPLEEKDFEAFQKLSAAFAALAEGHFGPLLVEENLYEERWIFPKANPQEAIKSTMNLPVDPDNKLGHALDMVPEQKHFDMMFRSGSRRLQVQMQPVTFENVTVQRRNALIFASRSRVERARRFTEQASRVPEYPSHALMLDVVLIEDEPPGLQGLGEQFTMLHKKAEIARNKLTVT